VGSPRRNDPDRFYLLPEHPDRRLAAFIEQALSLRKKPASPGSRPSAADLARGRGGRARDPARILSAMPVASSAVLAVLVLIWSTGCAGPAADVWPPSAGTRTVTVHVSVDRWHAMIAVPTEDRPQTPAIEEWGFAQRAWYLEGRQGPLDAVGALVAPSEGVVEVARAGRLWAERTPQPPAEVFAFQLDEDGLRRLRDHLAASLADPEPIATIGSSRFYRARQAYHLFNTCHPWAARALRAAGLPLSPGAALTRSLLSWQLARAVRLAATPR
jgi:hypothetical protein